MQTRKTANNLSRYRYQVTGVLRKLVRHMMHTSGGKIDHLHGAPLATPTSPIKELLHKFVLDTETLQPETTAMHCRKVTCQ